MSCTLLNANATALAALAPGKTTPVTSPWTSWTSERNTGGIWETLEVATGSEKKKHQSEIHRNSTFSQFESSGAAVERRSDFPALLPLSPAPGRGGHRSLKLSDLSDLSDRRIAQEWKCPGPLFAAMYISGILAMPSLDMIEIYGLNVFLPTPSHHVVQHL